MAKRALISNLSDVDIRLLRIFVTVTECGGFAASELELNIGRSTISKHISDLETRIGLILCNRGPSGFSLTKEGEQVMTATKRLLSRINEFQSEIDEVHSTITGTLRLGIYEQSSTNPNARVHEALSAFDSLAPDVELDVILDHPSVLESHLADQSLDIAIVPIFNQSSSFVYTPIYKERMALYCGREHPLYGTPNDAAVETLELQKYKYAGYSFNSLNMAAGRALGLRRAAKVKEEEALALLILSGRYFGYLAEHVAATFQEDRSVWRIAPNETSYTITFAAITRKQPQPDRKTMVFLDCLKRVHEGQIKPFPRSNLENRLEQTRHQRAEP